MGWLVGMTKRAFARLASPPSAPLTAKRGALGGDEGKGLFSRRVERRNGHDRALCAARLRAGVTIASGARSVRPGATSERQSRRPLAACDDR